MAYGYTPDRIIGKISEEYYPPHELRDKYNLLIELRLLDVLDEMVWGAGMELEAFISLFGKLPLELKEQKFFEGIDMNSLDMLEGDISEIAPIIFDRIRLRMIYTNGLTVQEILDQFVRSKSVNKMLHKWYFAGEDIQGG